MADRLCEVKQVLLQETETDREQESQTLETQGKGKREKHKEKGKNRRLGQDHDITSELSSEDIQFYKNIGIKFSSVLFLSNHQCLFCVPDAAAI